MKKVVWLLIVLISMTSSMFATGWDNSLLPEKTAIELLNNIQFSVSKVVNSRSKGVLEDEFSGVLNTISPASLQDGNIIEAYQALLNNLTELKLSESEKEQLLKQQEAQRKNAVFGVFNSFGSILTGVNPAQIAYVALNAGLNYARAVNDANMQASEKNFSIDQAELKTIDDMRSSLFISSAKVFSGKTNSVSGLISEVEMKDFAKTAIIVEQADKAEVSRNLASLQSKKRSFESFAPYWATLGDAYKKLEMYSSALEAYDKFESLMADNKVFRTNPYYLSVAKNRIAIMLQEESTDYTLINQYAQIVKENTPNVQTNLDDMYYFLCSVYAYTHNDAEALSSMKYLVSRGLEKKPNDGLLATFVTATCDSGKEGLQSRLVSKLIGGIEPGMSETVQEFVKAKKN